MSPSDAARILDLPADTTPEQLEARFNELRRKLEDKIAKAPTPGLQAKYRETLAEITTAFETLTLAADSSSLPVTTKQGAGSTEHGVRNASSPPVPSRSPQVGPPLAGVPPPAKRAKSGGKEFLIVALIAVALLGAGGWFVIKTRAENAEKTRLAAEQKAASDREAAAALLEKERLASVAREQEEARRQAEEHEKLRRERAGAQVHSQLAQLRLAWEALEEDHRRAERRLADLRSEERSLGSSARSGPTPEIRKLRMDIAAQAEFVEWLAGKLSRHPARVLRVQAEALLSARDIDQALRIATEANQEQQRAEREIDEARRELTRTTGSVELRVIPEDAQWVIHDSLGTTRSGAGSKTVDNVPLGPVRVEFAAAGYQPKSVEGSLRRTTPLLLHYEFPKYRIVLTSTPADAQVANAGRNLGTTPLDLDWPGEGKLVLDFRAAGHEPEARTLEVPADSSAGPVHVTLRRTPRGLARPDLRFSPRQFFVTRTYSSRSREYGAKPIDERSVQEITATADESSGEWTQITAKTTDAASSFRAYPTPAGATNRWRRDPKTGRWAFVDSQGTLNPHAPGLHLATPLVPVLDLDVPEFWPARELVNVGDTWEIPAHLLAYLGVSQQPVTLAPAEGRVSALRLTDGQCEADFTVVWKYADEEGEIKLWTDVSISGTMDLRRAFIAKLSITEEARSWMATRINLRKSAIEGHDLRQTTYDVTTSP